MSDKYGVGDIEEWNGRVLDRVISYEDFAELEKELAELNAKNRNYGRCHSTRSRSTHTQSAPQWYDGGSVAVAVWQ